MVFVFYARIMQNKGIFGKSSKYGNGLSEVWSKNFGKRAVKKKGITCLKLVSLCSLEVQNCVKTIFKSPKKHLKPVSGSLKRVKTNFKSLKTLFRKKKGDVGTKQSKKSLFGRLYQLEPLVLEA